MKWKRLEAGRYVSDNGMYMVERDVTGYVTIDQREGDGLLAGCDDDGWSAAYGDEVLDWFDTKREAVAYCEKHRERNHDASEDHHMAVRSGW